MHCSPMYAHPPFIVLFYLCTLFYLFIFRKQLWIKLHIFAIIKLQNFSEPWAQSERLVSYFCFIGLVLNHIDIESVFGYLNECMSKERLSNNFYQLSKSNIRIQIITTISKYTEGLVKVKKNCCIIGFYHHFYFVNLDTAITIRLFLFFVTSLVASLTLTPKRQ